ncbi:MAG TPA: hypothetical protein VGN89_11390, partial [Phenylobacterium sp.]|nr:hypothetical protein [Phenylobacterium sp.]
MSPLGSNDAGMAHLDTYLDQVRRNLKNLPKSEADEIIAELRSHVLDRTAGQPTPNQVEAAIAALGSPREVARVNLTERVGAEVEEDRSPLTVLRGIGRLAGLSIYGAFAGLVSFTGYVLSAGFVITAISKLFNHSNAGLWRVPSASDDYSYSFGVIPNQQGQELLG